MAIDTTINGKAVSLTAEPDTPLALGDSRGARAYRHQIWLRYRGLRGLFGACGRRNHPVVQRTGERCRGEINHHHRRPEKARTARSTPCRQHGSRAGAAMRVLPVGPDHGRSRAYPEKRQADRRADRRGDDQHLPLRHLPAHPQGHPRRNRAGRNRCRRSRMMADNPTLEMEPAVPAKRKASSGAPS